MQAKNYLRSRYQLISLRLYVDYSYMENEIYRKWVENDSLANHEKTLIQTIDSIIVRLSNGLTWNIMEGPPEKPTGFIFKLFTKKGKADQKFIDYRKYLEFCSRWEETKKPCEIIAEYTAYTSIHFDEERIFRAKYDVVYHPRSEAICREVILVD